MNRPVGRVLVTGGAGFIGSHVADAFLGAGWHVDLLDDLSTGRRERVPRGVTLHELDICSSEAAEVVRSGEFDVICHLAAQIDVRVSVADPLRDARLNVLGTINLAKAAGTSRRPPRFVFSSTGGAIYGDRASPPTPEHATKEPASPYGIGKLSAEHYLRGLSALHGFDAVALRYANVYGPRQDRHGEAGVVAIFCGLLLDQRPLKVFGDGLQTRDYVFVGDVARANLLAARAELPAVDSPDARSFNIGTGRETTVIELASILREVARSNVGIEHVLARAGEQLRSAVDAAKAGRVLGWKAECSLRKGLADTYAWFAAHHQVPV